MLGLTIDIPTAAVQNFHIIDNFNRPDNSVTLGNAETGQPWSGATGYGIIENQAYALSANNGAVIDSYLANATLQATLATNIGLGRLLFRYTSTSNYLQIVPVISGAYKIYKTVAGSAVEIGSHNTMPANGDLIKVVYVDSLIKLYINGTLKLTVAEEFNKNATKVGIKSGYTANRYDNFQLEG